MRISVVMPAIFVALALPLCAQIDNGNITGRVTDQSGAIIPGAQVTLTQTEMNFETVATTNEEGLYRAVNLRPGPYKIAVVAQGFKKMVRDNVDLHTGQTLAVNMPLEVGAVTDAVEVKANAQLLETETSSAGNLVSGDYFYKLPNFQRSTKAILFFTPGVSFNNMAYTGRFDNMRVNGLGGGTLGVFEDGALGTVGNSGSGNATDTILNTIEDIKVITNTLPAEYGHSAGGVISMVKKSGTNLFHGILSEYGRTRRMQQRKYFDLYKNSQPQPGWDKAPGLIVQNPDANLSGPVYIPKIYDGRNKTFFMVAWQGYIEKQSKQATGTVPTAAMLGGDFNFPGVTPNAIYDPTTTRQDASGSWFRDPFPGNIVPKAAWSKVAQTVLGMTPFRLPNVVGSMGNGGPSNNIMLGPMKVVVWDSWSFRFDHQFSQNLKAYATWTYNSRWEKTPSYIIANSFFDSTQNKNISPKQNTASAGVTWIVTPTVVNDLRGSYYENLTTTTSIAYNQDYAKQLGIAGLPSTCMPGIWPTGITIDPALAVTNTGLAVGCPNKNAQEILTLKDDVSKSWGTHSFKFGYELLRYRQNNWDLSSPDGNFSYTGTGGLTTTGGGVSNTGNTLATFMVGAVSSVSFSRRLQSNLPRVWQHSFYLQDDWKVTPTLTLNLGMRYNIETPAKQKYGFISIFDVNAPDTSQYTNYTCPTSGCKGAWTHPQGASPYSMDLGRWDPRFGMAWHPLSKMVLRGGFSLAHTDMRTTYLYTDELMNDSVSIAQAPGNFKPLFMLDSGVPQFNYPAHRADGSVPYVGNPGASAQGTANMLQSNLKTPYIMTWNLGIQRELGTNYMVEVQYRGSAQAKGTGGYDLNTRPWGIIPDLNGGSGLINLEDPANSALRLSWANGGKTQSSRPWNNLGTVNMQGNVYHMSHNEGSVRIEKRYSKGLAFQAFYTYAKSLEGGAGNPYLNWHLFKARTGLDQTHNFTGTMNYEIPIGKGRHFLNRGGWINTFIGGFDFVWTYTIASGQPAGMGISGGPTTYNYPGFMPTYGGVMLLQRPQLRSNWQDLGNDRFTQNNQNSMIDCGAVQVGWGNDCMTYVPSFSRGTNGANLWTVQRTIAASFSASKEVAIKERLKFQFRLDFQNPFKWYNLGGPNSTLNIQSLTNAKSFGTVAPGSESTSAAYGGLPMMNITLALKW